MKRSKRVLIMRLTSLVTPLLPIMLLAVGMGAAGYLCAIFITLFGGAAMGSILGYSMPFGPVDQVFLCIFLFAVLRGILRYAEQASNHYIAFKLLALIRDKVFRALRRLAPAKLEGRDKGDLISLITADIEQLEVFYAHTISPVLIAFLCCAVMTAFVASFHLLPALLLLCGYLTVGVFIPAWASRKGERAGKEYRAAFAETNSYVLESLRGLRETLQYGTAVERTSGMAGCSASLSQKQQEMKHREGITTAAVNTVILLTALAVLLSCVFLYQAGKISAAEVMLSVMASLGSFGPVVALANLAANLVQTFASANRVFDLLDEKPVIEEITNQHTVSFAGAACGKVSFAYGEETVLDQISFAVPQNKIVGITGKSGSGKSTILRLMMRFWDVQHGEITVSGTGIDKINTVCLRDMQSLVTQETELFDDTIENNIRIAKLDASHEEIVSACKKAAIYNFIQDLPKGFHTKIGELGGNLSGGERQRIGVARAFLHNAPFVLMDEPTSNLDSLNEGIILRSIEKERANKTVLLVSHRASTMAIADKTYSVECGRMS